MAICRVLIVLLLTASLQAMAAEVSNLRVWADPNKTRAVLDLSEPAEYKLFTLKNPHRVVIDLQSARLGKSFQLEAVKSGLIMDVLKNFMPMRIWTALKPTLTAGKLLSMNL